MAVIVDTNTLASDVVVDDTITVDSSETVLKYEDAGGATSLNHDVVPDSIA